MNDNADAVMQNRPLHRMFTAVPRRYDLINSVITWGQDKRWRMKAASECLTDGPNNVLDLCCGTGDLAVTIARLATAETNVVGIDYSQPMLDIARAKADKLAADKQISFICDDAANLPFEAGSFDCVGISFAFRNLTYKNPVALEHLAEVLRVLRAGGRYVIIESSQPKSMIIRKLYHIYLRVYVRTVGSILSGNDGAYTYLAESASRFYNPDEVSELLADAGFRQASYRQFLFGATALHTAVK